MKKLDRYILGKFLGTFFFIVTMILAIAIVFDVSEKIDDFIKKEAPLDAIILQYYSNFVITYGITFSSLLTFLAVIIFTSKMASDMEIVAILNSGISYKRFLYPYFWGALCIASITFVANNWILPSSNKTFLDFEEKYIRNEKSKVYKHIHRQIKPGHYIYFRSYNDNDLRGYNFTYETFDDYQLSSKFYADALTWDTLRNQWMANEYTERIISPNGKETISKGKKKLTEFDFYPEELYYVKESVKTMNYGELNEFIRLEKIRGAENIKFYEIEKHQRSSYPFSTFILTLIAVSIASRKSRGGIAINIAAAIMLVMVYMLFMKVSVTFSTNGELAPFVACWIPNFLYAILAIYLYKKAQK